MTPKTAMTDVKTLRRQARKPIEGGAVTVGDGGRQNPAPEKDRA